MARVTIDDPEEVSKKTVDKSGRVYLGRDYAGEDIRIAFEVVDDDE